MPITEQRLREIYGEPSPLAAAKTIYKLDQHCRDFIANATFLVLATSDGENIDVSPKGDPAGFVHVEDDHHLLIPDRPGNNRIDGLINIIQHPKIALIFMIPSVTETLRINGSAEIIEDEAICNLCQINGRRPKTVTRITIDEAFLHCGKAPLRAGLWKTETWPSARPVPTLFAMAKDHAGVPVKSVEQSAVDEAYQRTLY